MDVHLITRQSARQYGERAEKAFFGPWPWKELSKIGDGVPREHMWNGFQRILRMSIVASWQQDTYQKLRPEG